MKNYNEMAQSVLKRRDIEVKRRKKAFLIGAPCAAAVLVGAAGIGTAVASRSRSVQIQDLYFIHNAADVPNSSAEIAEAGNIDLPEISADIADAPAEPIDYTNPNVGKNDIKVLRIEKFKENVSGSAVDPNDFVPYTLEQLDSFYGLRFNRLGELYPSWKFSHDELGIYRRETNDGSVAKLEMYNTRNSIEYTTESGAKIGILVQHGKFEPVSDEMLTADKPVNVPKPEVINEYDENGNIIGQTTPAYDPAENKPVPDEGASTVNGYEALIYCDENDVYLADLDMASRVRISAAGLSEDEFLEVLDNFTNNVEGPVKTASEPAADAPAEPTGYTNPNVGQNDIKVLDLDEFNIKEKSIDLSNGTFYEYTLEELDKIYNLRFNILGELHPDWELSHDKLGMYNVEYFGERASIWIQDPDNFSECNTLNYITDNGAAVTVSAQPNKFEPVSDEIFTDDKPTDPSKYTTETAYDDDGNPIGFLSKPIDPDNWRPDTDEGVSTVNGYEALIYCNADGNFLADLNMVYSRVRITADGMSEEEFLMILDEFTKL